MVTDAPLGFRRSTTSGLIVPEPVSRQRIVLPKQDGKAIERATKILKALGIDVFFRCHEQACQKAPIERIRLADGSFTLRCEHADRLFQQHF